ncbi:MAG: hypothetical protein ACFE9L_16175, partial [Candidatus Hodarchaeota archaeon]
TLSFGFEKNSMNSRIIGGGKEAGCKSISREISLGLPSAINHDFVNRIHWRPVRALSLFRESTCPFSFVLTISIAFIKVGTGLKIFKRYYPKAPIVLMD